MSLGAKLRWVAVLYFAQGFPFGIAIDNIPVYFRSQGVSLAEVGLLSLLGAPWTLKVLWAPAIDRFGSRRHWIGGSLLCMALLIALVPLFDPGSPGFWLWAILLLFTTASATQDVAIDAYTIGLLRPGEEGVANGVRVSAYRAALVVGGGGLVVLAGTVGWPPTFWIAALLLLLLAGATLFLPTGEARRPVTRNPWWRPLITWLRRPGAISVLFFVLVYKLGDAAMGPMIRPFWLDRGLSLEEIGLVSTSAGVVASLLGALLGGLYTSRAGILRALWVLGLAQAGSNLVYASVAAAEGGRLSIYGASLFESFTAGLGTAAFLSFLMHICDKEEAATEYAFLSALFGLTRALAGATSGFAADRLGYAGFFAATFLLALPAYLVLPRIGGWVRDRADGPDSL